MNESTTLYESKLKIYKRGALIYALSAIAITTAAFIIGAEEGSRYLSDNFFTYLFYVFVSISVIFAVTAVFFFKGHGITHGDRGGAGQAPWASLLTAAGAICVIFTSIKEMVGEGGGLSAFSLAIILSALFAVTLSLYGLFPISDGLSVASGYMQIMLCILMIAKLYLDHSLEMNAPVKLLGQFALVSVMIGTLSDVRILIGRSRAGLYLFTKICVAVLPTVATVGALIGIVTSPEKYSSIYLVAPLFALSYAIPSTIKLMRAGLIKAEDNEPELESNRLSIKEVAEEIYDSDKEEDDE